MIRHEVVVTTRLPVATSRGSILLWCQTMGYRLTSPPFLSSVEVERGSWVGNVGSLNPKTWRSKIRANFRPLEDGCEVRLEWLVTTVGQVGTKSDIQFWTYEVQRTLESALGVLPDIRAYSREAGKAQLGNTWRALVFTASLVVPLVGVWVATESGVYGIASATVLGTATWLVFRVPRRLPEIVAPAAAPPISTLAPDPLRDNVAPHASAEPVGESLSDGSDHGSATDTGGRSQPHRPPPSVVGVENAVD